MQVTAVPMPPINKLSGTGGFLDPEMIVSQFGIEDGMSVADFGSGSGYFTILLGEKVGPTGRVFALDVMENALETVRGKARAHGLNNVETIRTNLEIVGSSSLPNESQDMVLAANLFFQSKKRENIIKEVFRVLKKNKEFIVIDWKKGAGGFGPPDDLRPDPEETKTLIEKNNLVFKQELFTGQFHFGLIFKKK